MLGVIADVVTGTAKAAAAIAGRFDFIDENDEHSQRVEAKYNELEGLAEVLRNAEPPVLPPSCEHSLQTFNESVNTCSEVCKDIRNKKTLGKLYYAQRHKHDLETLEQVLSEERQSLQQICFRVLIAQNEELKRHVEEGETRVTVVAVHPGIGIYKGAAVRISKENVPRTPDKPEVNVDEALMSVMWSDAQNRSQGIVRYEVRYEGENELIVSGTPKELKVGKKKGDTYAISLGPPRVIPGLYTIQVRAVSRLGGPGEWSEATVARLESGPPDKPKKPVLTVLSPIEVLVQVHRLKAEEENGKPVNECIVEYMLKSSTTAISQWQFLQFPIKRDNSEDVLKYSIRGLEPGSVYRVRVKMVNGAGTSSPSKTEEVYTEQLVPGPPQGLHTSSKRTDKTIKIRWKPPAIHPQVVRKYVVQMQLKKGSEWSALEQDIIGEKLSATIRGLKANTKYHFRVAASNNKGEVGVFSKTISAQTRCGLGGRLAVAAGAFLGGTIGAPLLGAVGIGKLAGSTARNSVGSNTAKVAACAVAGMGGVVTGTIVGTVGAPLFGIAAGALGYEGAAGNLTDWSPQSSDDEREPSAIRELWKASIPA